MKGVERMEVTSGGAYDAEAAPACGVRELEACACCGFRCESSE